MTTFAEWWRWQQPVLEAPTMSDDELRKILSAAHKAVPAVSWWRHRKGGHYQVAGHCLIEATREAGVLYYGRSMFIRCRPLSEFLDGRFERLPDVPAGWGEST